MSDTQTQPPHILVVDDNVEIVAFLKEAVLEPAGYKVTGALDGEEGLTLAKTIHPDLILLDYDMPRLNGIQVLQALKDQNITLPVILVTSHGSESVAVEVFRLGVLDYVPKPFMVNDLLASIERVLTLTRLRQERDTLFEKLERTNSELLNRLRQLDTLYRVSKSVTTLQERDKLLERIVDAALYLTGAQDGQLILLDPETGNPTTNVSREYWDKEYVTPANLPDIQTQSLDLILNAPLEWGGKIVGSLTVSNKRNRKPLNPGNRRLLRMLGDYAAIAIENFRLLAEVETRREREKRELRELFQHYVSPAIVNRILENPHNIQPGGQWQTVAVLFADLREFMAFSANASPEALVSVLNRHLTQAAGVILSEEGTLDKFMGDEIMAFFNAPIPQEDYALRAVRAAWRIQQSLHQTHELIPLHQRLRFGIGVATGEAIVGNVGAPDLVNYTVVGQIPNKAHMLQELAPAGKILICHRTYQLVKDAFHTQELPPVLFKGQQHPEPIYEVRAMLY
ncbi:MAG TPA: response regulator [Anaerolineae bacterium]|nr:response regulator [Anaerolineae bacterium]HQK13038.1 response regulator [Anaerolineae bacterium]